MTKADYIKREDAIRICKMPNYNIHDILFALKTIPGKIVPAADGQRDRWISVNDALPEPYTQVIVTWVNHMPAPYYSHIKDKPFVATAVWYCGAWYWWNDLIEDMLKEYGERGGYPVDSAIEVTHWMPLPKPPEVEE